MENYLQLVLIALIFGIIGYLIGKNTAKSSSLNDDSWKIELENCQKSNKDLHNRINDLNSTYGIQNNFVGSTQSKIFDSASAKESFGKKVKENDLKIIEGIGPKIEELFNTSGILTWKSLSESSIDRLREILTKAGEGYQIHDPSSWPKQAKYAYEGKWQDLKDWQNSLDGGREV